MKHLGKFMFGALALVLASCSSDEPTIGGGNNGNDADFYATLKLRLPVADGTRANNGTEFGKDFENNVGKILVVLATMDDNGTYRYLTSAESDAQGNGTSGSEVKYTLNFSSKDLSNDPLSPDAPGSTIPTSKVYVFAYCNPSKTLISTIEGKTAGSEFTDEIASITDKDNADIWQKNRFLMTNCEISDVKEIPSRLDLVTNHNTPEKAVDLGTVRVKRVAVRFDFATTNDNVYSIKDIDGKTEIGKIELTDMAMFNIAKNFHYLPRTNANWSWTGKTTLCGDLEGYVMSFNKDNFKGKDVLAGYTDYYYSNLIGNPLESVDSPDADELKWTSIRPQDWNKQLEDTDEGWNPNNTEYRIWRYATENTIPAAENGKETGSQKVGITTGVVFKGVLTANDTEKWNGNTVYVHNNLVYGDFDALQEYVTKNPETIVAAEFKTVFGDEKPSNLKENLLKHKPGDKRLGFNAYEADKDGKYVMYYFYYNRHMSNGNNSVMGENEFGVVRNNVYKLAVTTIKSLGKPDASQKPDDPDEEENAFFTVSCLVMPWTVRVNNIDF